MEQHNEGVPTPVAGEATLRVRKVAQRHSLTRTISSALAVATLTAAVLLWATRELGQKADVQVVDALASRVSVLEPRVAAVDRDLDWLKADTGWIKQVLWQMAQRGGVLVPPPPSTPLTPLEPSEAP